MFCPKCGSGIEDNTRYCPFCGEKLDPVIGAYAPKAGGSDRGAALQTGSIGTFFSNNVFRLLITAVMTTAAVLLTAVFFSEFGTAFSVLSGLEKKSAAICTLIYVLAVFIPVLLSFETIRKSLYITAKVKPKDFNIRRYAVTKGALVPVIIDLLVCLVLVISPLILYNYKQYDEVASMYAILERYRYASIICCVLCVVTIVLITFSRRRVRHSSAF